MNESSYSRSTALTPTRENYLRSLYQLARAGAGVRLTDLANVQGVRLPTARHAVNRLREAGLVAQENYGLITLTDKGRDVGRQICDRFELTRKFLIEVLGVSETDAEQEACIMEHHLGEETLNRIAAFVTHVTGAATHRDIAEALHSLRLKLLKPPKFSEPRK
jgi:DtxR family transcriptional regulator, Mn-dependent transcriptional regulator